MSGDLDRIFSVLLDLGRVEHMLQQDWKPHFKRTAENWSDVRRAIHHLNNLKSFKDIREYLSSLPQGVLDSLVLEVARELADYNEASGSLH